MPRCVAFLCAINVGGRNVTMKTLRAVLAPFAARERGDLDRQRQRHLETRGAPAKLEARIAKLCAKYPASLLDAQRGNRIHARRAPHGHVAGGERADPEQPGRAEQRERIEGPDFEQHARHETR